MWEYRDKLSSGFFINFKSVSFTTTQTNQSDSVYVIDNDNTISGNK